ncbi:Ferric/cupric reductase transmembrane component 1 [Hypsizygus marmoreus]|uniref:Ferric/cupric reductase transmembrane component 1 n=1 Tax=Hypsizygus marmoreus TaxID=39966 RepID=A0A369JIP8_HYPMA|nr:Ferric/cupric reductase transmembrane component 1 [Hypsizygus marmoreus]
MITPANPITPNISDDAEWIKTYLVMHSMSGNSLCYAYFLWFGVAIVSCAFAILHLSGCRGNVIGAYWSKWGLRRRTWRGKYTLAVSRRTGERPHPESLPSNGQLLCVSVLFIAVLLLAFVGPDYISPSYNFFNLSTISVDPDYRPQYTITKAWWTSGGRTGIMAFALLPLCILFALKAPPFALFALPAIQMHFDKLAWLHRWSGRLFWLLSTAHVLFWSIQLLTDQRMGTSHLAYRFAWQHREFIYGWVGYLLLTLLMALSVSSLRKRKYDVFYTFHLILFPLAITASALHHPPIAWWCWSALGIWIGERVWRGTWYLYCNGYFRLHPHRSQKQRYSSNIGTLERALLNPVSAPDSLTYPPFALTSLDTSPYLPPPGYAHAELLSGAMVRVTYVTPRSISWAPGQHFLVNIPVISATATHPFTTVSVYDEHSLTNVLVFLIRSKTGWTRKLWQYVSKLYAEDEIYPAPQIFPEATIMPKSGVLLKMYVEGPFGSSVRAQWGSHSTILVVVGGSGVSFGLSILEFACLCLAGRDGKQLGAKPAWWGSRGFSMRRVRFVWLIREFGHIQWCASIIRRCMSIIPPPALEVQIFVTNFYPKGPSTALPSEPFTYPPPTEALPVAGSRFARDDTPRLGIYGTNSLVDLSGRTTTYGDEGRDPVAISSDDLDDYTLYLTNFEGDNGAELVGEALLNSQVKKAGKLRRATTRKLVKSSTAEKERDTPRQYHYKRASQAYGRHGSDSADVLLPSEHRAEVHTTPHWRSDSQFDIEWSPKPPSAAGIALPWFVDLRFPSTPRSATHVEAPRGPNEEIANLFQPRFPFSDPAERDHINGSKDAKQPHLHVNERELHDISVVAEYTRPGKPKIPRILGDEVRAANGSVLVACCGPASLDAMVRKAVAAAINPMRIHREDTGYIELVSENFDY